MHGLGDYKARDGTGLGATRQGHRDSLPDTQLGTFKYFILIETDSWLAQTHTTNRIKTALSQHCVCVPL